MGPIGLCARNLELIPPDVRLPGYGRDRCEHSIVHIGVGAFHRAHQAVYLDDLLNRGESAGWAIHGVGLLPQDLALQEALKRQDCLYTVVEIGAAGRRARVIGSLFDHLYAPGEREAAISKMAAPACRIVSLTITEGGYLVNGWTGEFDAAHPDVRHDLGHPGEPACWLGYLAEALDRRRGSGLPPFTVLSCDNLQHNGDVAKQALLGFAALRNPALSKWLAENGAFPNSMVDRITPVTTPEHRSMVAREFGVADACPVVTEPFRQWVIEERFCAGRPAWERAGALITSDVLPYEKIKIRLLNGSHQALCYLGMLLGHEYVHEAIADPQILPLVRELMDAEVSPLLPQAPGVDLAEYKATLMQRFGNPAIQDRLSRIATDASARIPKFVLPSIAEQLARGGPIQLLSLAIAGWFRYLAVAREISDPLSARLMACARDGGPDPSALLEIREIFGDALAGNLRFRARLRDALRSLYQRGVRATLAEAGAHQQQ